MDDEKRAVQEALNRSLSGLRPDPYLARRVIAEAEGERKVKKQISKGLVIAVALTLVLAGTAYAAFSSQVVEFYRKYANNPQMGEWLEQGKAAQIGETMQLGGVSVTLDEVVYRSHGLYALGTIRTLDGKDVLVPNSIAGMPEDFLGSEQSGTFIEQARQRGGRLLTAQCIPSRISVDGGEMLSAGGFLYFDSQNMDGSLTFGFEVTNGLAIAEGSRYAMEVSMRTVELAENGMERTETETQTRMTVEFVPKLIQENAKQEEAQADASLNDDYAVIAPEAYRETGALPVLQAVRPDFTGIVKPDWFTDQPVVQENHPGEEATYMTANYGALIVLPEAFYYSEYEGTYDEAVAALDPASEGAVFPQYTLAREIAELAENAFYNGAYQHSIFGEMKTPGRDALHGITKKQAMERAERMLAALGLNGWQCSYCLDMSVERIREMGRQMAQAIEDGRYLTDDDCVLRYDQAKEADEGYFLYYAPAGLSNVSRERFKLILYVTGSGIPYANVRSDYIPGETVEMTASLVTPQSVLPKLAQEIGHARNPKTVEGIEGAVLVYTPARVKEEGGMVMTPTWHITFRQKSARGIENEGWAEFNAVNGELLDASFL